MRILVTGKGTGGSWQIRGLQLGTAIGACAQAMAYDLNEIDLVIGVKRIPASVLAALQERDRRIPFVWDIVDAWPQKDPNGNNWDYNTAVTWLRSEIQRIAPDAMVFPTQEMTEDSDFKGPRIVLPHHAWPKYAPSKIRQIVSTVGYEGGLQYLGKWASILKEECERRNWHFSPNSNMLYNDIVVAVRDMDGHPAKHWKSNCKLANIQALGLPAICTEEDSYLEFGSGAEIFVVDRLTLSNAFDMLTPFKTRQGISVTMQRNAPTLDNVSREYLSWLEQLKS